MPPSASLTINLLGPLIVTVDSRPIELPTDKARALLAYLALEYTTAHPRRSLATLLWPDLPEERALRNLTNTLVRIRSVVGDDLADTLLLTTTQTIQFRPEATSGIDTIALDRLLASCNSHPHRAISRCPGCAERLSQAAWLIRGPLLAGLSLDESDEFSTWITIAREQRHRQMVSILSELATFHELHRALPDALAMTDRILRVEPWREETHRQVMRILALSGQRAAALRQFERCRRSLQRELALSPEPETERLAQAIRNGELIAEPTPPLQLPMLSQSFIGRTQEIAYITNQLVRTDCRLLSIVGPGGSGKTTLAIHAAAKLAGTFRDGIFFVSLLDAPTHELACLAIATAIGYSFTGTMPFCDQLIHALALGERLILLDNAEQLLPHVNLLADLLAQAPQLSLLVTSRRRLKLRAEYLLDLHGLTTPVLDDPDPERFDAVQLFIARARQTRSDHLLHQELHAIVRICNLVAGLPLGIELAATQGHGRSYSAIADALAQRLDVLDVALSDVPPHHRSLTAIFDYSWNELSPTSQAVLQMLAVFPGSFSVEAVAAVTGSDIVTHPLLEQTMAILSDQALLTQRQSGYYALHPLLRHYTLTRATHPELQTRVRSQFMVYYLTRLIEADLQVVNSATQARAALLVEEFENIRTAWEWAVQTGDAHWLDHAAHPLTILVICRGWPRLTVTFLAQGATALETSSLRSARFVRGRLLAMESLAWRMLGNYSYVLQCAEQALVLLKGSEDPASIAMAQNLIGATKIEEGDYEEAEHYLDQALTLATEHQQPVITANTHFWHGRLAVFRGEFDLAKIHLHCSLELYRSVNEEIGALRCMNILAELPARRHDDLLSSLASFEEVLIHARRLGDARTLSVALENVGVTRVLTGQDPAPALALLEESLALNQKIGNTVGLSYLLHAIAYAHIHLGHFDAAAHALQQGIAHLGVKRLGEQPQLRNVLLELLEGFGLLYSRQGDSVKAVEILSLAATHPSTPDFTRRRATQELATLAAQLSAESYAAAAERGRTSSLDQLLPELVDPSAMQLG